MSGANGEVPADQVLTTEERNSTLDHKMSNTIRIKEEQEEPELQQMAETKEEPEPEPTKEEHIELWVFQEEGQMLVMQKTNTSVVTPTHEEILYNIPGLPQVIETKEEPEPVLIKEEQVDPCSDQNEVQLHLHMKLDTDSITVTSTDEQNNSSDPELNKNQLLPANRPEPENQHQQGSNQEDSGRGDPSLRPEKRRQNTRSNGVNSSELKRQKTDTASCEICGKLFRMRQHLPDDIKIHTGEKLHPCEVCGKAFRRRGHSSINKRICTSETPKTYKLLGKTSSDQASKVENAQEKLHPCEVCGKAFRRRGHSIKSEIIHTSETPNPCILYAKTSNDQAGKVENTQEKLHPCEVCGKAFKACDRLPHHLQKRRGEKPFSSQTCGKSFTWNSSALHIRSHTGEKPLPCEVCGKHFK